MRLQDCHPICTCLPHRARVSLSKTGASRWCGRGLACTSLESPAVPPLYTFYCLCKGCWRQQRKGQNRPMWTGETHCNWQCSIATDTCNKQRGITQLSPKFIPSFSTCRLHCLQCTRYFPGNLEAILLHIQSPSSPALSSGQKVWPVVLLGGMQQRLASPDFELAKRPAILCLVDCKK